MIKWNYYNRALIPEIAPHEEIDEKNIKFKKIWKMNWKEKPLLIKWTTDFDCLYKTEWWYCIKDSPFNINDLKAKRRYEITKGIKNFKIEIINPENYFEDIFIILLKAYEGYPLKYRPKIIKEEIRKNIKKWSSYTVFGAFDFNQNLCGYAIVNRKINFIELKVLKTIPKYEKKGINAGIIYFILEYYKEALSKGIYICNGERNISHETNFPEYLEKYFMFRKAYCKLNLKYRKSLEIVLKIIFPFRKFIKKIDKNIFLHKVNSILVLEEIRRSFK